jgi:hypothetical protein
MGPPKAMNGGGSSSSGGASSSSAPAPLDVDAFPDALSFPDTPDTPPGHDGFPGFEPPPEVWEEVGAKKKAKKMAAAARKDAPPAPASPPASTASTAQGKKPAVPASFAAPEGKGKGKAPASPPIGAPPSPNVAVNARATSAAAEPGSNKKPKKPVGVLPKAELQSRCEAILANGSATGFMVLDKYAASFAADMVRCELRWPTLHRAQRRAARPPVDRPCSHGVLPHHPRHSPRTRRPESESARAWCSRALVATARPTGRRVHYPHARRASPRGTTSMVRRMAVCAPSLRAAPTCRSRQSRARIASI